MATVWFAAPGASFVSVHYLAGAIFGKFIASPIHGSRASISRLRGAQHRMTKSRQMAHAF
jgi:hypothetical protein